MCRGAGNLVEAVVAVGILLLQSRHCGCLIGLPFFECLRLVLPCGCLLRLAEADRLVARECVALTEIRPQISTPRAFSLLAGPTVKGMCVLAVIQRLGNLCCDVTN